MFHCVSVHQWFGGGVNNSPIDCSCRRACLTCSEPQYSVVCFCHRSSWFPWSCRWAPEDVLADPCYQTAGTGDVWPTDCLTSVNTQMWRGFQTVVNLFFFFLTLADVNCLLSLCVTLVWRSSMLRLITAAVVSLLVTSTSMSSHFFSQ